MGLQIEKIKSSQKHQIKANVPSRRKLIFAHKTGLLSKS